MRLVRATERLAPTPARPPRGRRWPSDVVDPRVVAQELEMDAILAGPGQRSSEMEVRAQPDVIDLLLVELAVRRVAAEVLEQQLEIARHQHAIELDAPA